MDNQESNPAQATHAVNLIKLWQMRDQEGYRKIELEYRVSLLEAQVAALVSPPANDPAQPTDYPPEPDQNVTPLKGAQ